MLIYQEFLALNEELAAFDPNDKLRWAVHEIVIKMKVNEDLKIEELSKRLKEYKIDVSPELLLEIFKAWDSYKDPDYSIFKKEDKNWMGVWPYAGYIKRETRGKQNFGKHRKKDTYNTEYSQAYNDGYWKNSKWANDKKTNYDYYGD